MKIEDKLREMAGRLITGAMEDGDVEVGVLCEAADMIEMQGWRTIESAPKDERILGWDGEILTLDWNKHGKYWQQVSDSCRSSAYCPTHWRPLPDPPSSPPHGTMVS